MHQKRATQIDKKNAMPVNDPTSRKITSPKIVTRKKRVNPTASVTEVEKELDKLKVRKDKDREGKSSCSTTKGTGQNTQGQTP